MEKLTPKLRICGGKKLYGEVEVRAAKNAVLPILAASLIADGTITLHNCEPISDTVKMLSILNSLGCRVTHDGLTLTVNSSTASAWEIPPALAHEIRSSIFLLGSILARFRVARVAYPGGCDIGIRPIDLHLKGLKALNVKITEKDGFIVCDGRDMAGGIVHLDSPSVGATENIMLAAVRAKGATRIINPAKEPEIADLQNFINALGGKVSGAGTGSIYIEGADSLSGVEYTPIPDRIAAGTYITACGICSGKIKLTNVVPDHIYSLITKLREANINITIDKNEITADCARRPQSVQIIETAPHPGFATDLQAQTAALQTISDGTSMIIENIFESRYKYVPELIKMGANITVRDRMAIIRGVSTLHGGDVTAKDLRGGAALVLAGLAADGTTAVDGVHHIDRGYYKLERTLSLLGADIVRTY